MNIKYYNLRDEDFPMDKEDFKKAKEALEKANVPISYGWLQR